jgi:hypothetical protein
MVECMLYFVSVGACTIGYCLKLLPCSYFVQYVLCVIFFLYLNCTKDSNIVLSFPFMNSAGHDDTKERHSCTGCN